jgi:cytochrome c-type biogenesis protein CcmE
MKPKHKRLQLAFIVLIFISLGLWLILKNFNDNIVFFFSPSELKEKHLVKDKNIRVGGLVLDGSIIREGLETKFTITDNKTELTIQFHGALPTLFRANQGIIAKGKLIGNLFIAEELLAKHDENYMPKEVADSLKKSGTWQGSK